MDAIVLYLESLRTLLEQTGWWLIAGLAAAGLVHAFVPAEALKRQLSGRGFVSSAKAAAAGVVLPLCSCSVIPVAAGLRRSGASRGATASFAISTPQTGEESIPITWALLGPVFALTRPVAAIITAVLAGTLIDRFGSPKPANSSAAGRAAGSAASPTTPGGCCGSTTPANAEPESESGPGSASACCSASVTLTVVTSTTPATPATPAPSCCASKGAPTRPGLAARFASALRHAFMTLPRDLAPWLVVGFLLSALVSAAVPTGWIAEHVGTGLGPMLLMLGVGLPLYICATSSTPLAYTLVVAGLSPGAALVLLLAGPATNAATIAWAVRDLGIRGTAIYLAVVAGVAIAFGVGFDAVAVGPIVAADMAHVHEHGPTVLTTTGAVALVGIMLWGLAATLRARLARPSGSKAGPKSDRRSTDDASPRAERAPA